MVVHRPLQVPAKTLVALGFDWRFQRPDWQNALIAGWILRRQMDRPDVGGQLEAVGSYHKGEGEDVTSRRIRKVYVAKFIAELRVLVGRCGGQNAFQTALR